MADISNSLIVTNSVSTMPSKCCHHAKQPVGLRVNLPTGSSLVLCDDNNDDDDDNNNNDSDEEKEASVKSVSVPLRKSLNILIWFFSTLHI